MQATMVQIGTPDGLMQIYDAVPRSPVKGAVIVMHGALGLEPDVQVVCQVLAGRGWRAVAPALFHRTGHLTADPSQESMEKLATVLETDEHVLADVDAAHGYLLAAGFAPESIALLGFCWGGRAAFLTAAHRSLAACASFYPAGLVETVHLPGIEFTAPQPPLVELCPTMKSPWLGIVGTEDPYIPEDQIAELEAQLDKFCPVDHEVRRYQGQSHAFVHRGIATKAEPDFEGDAGDAMQTALAFIEARVG